MMEGGNMNDRGYYIEIILELIKNSVHPERFNIVEVGCTFKEIEGMSTYVIAEFIRKNKLKARFVSIDYNPEHIEACRAFFKKYDESLTDTVELLCGPSLDILPPVLEEMGEVHFAFLDGGAHPEICLREFELVARALPVGCACLVDDLQEIITKTKGPCELPLGKGTLIYPLLLIAKYLKARTSNSHLLWGFKPGHESDIINSLDIKAFKNFLGEKDFKFLGKTILHKMLLFGDRNIIENVREFKREKVTPGKVTPGKVTPAKVTPGIIPMLYSRIRKMYSKVKVS
jgi:SAM-dependent methyltransferase